MQVRIRVEKTRSRRTGHDEPCVDLPLPTRPERVLEETERVLRDIDAIVSGS